MKGIPNIMSNSSNDKTAPGYNLPCINHHPRTYRQCGCPPPAPPIAPEPGDPCPVCRRNGANYGSIACKREHFEQALAKHKVNSGNWHKTWDETEAETIGSLADKAL